ENNSLFRPYRAGGLGGVSVPRAMPWAGLLRPFRAEARRNSVHKFTEVVMVRIEAVFRHGVFEPLGPVNLQEEQRVRLSIEPTSQETPESWLNRVQKLQAVVLARQGFLPNS